MSGGDYGGEHQSLRRAALPYAYGKRCGRCGQPMVLGQPLDLDHTDDRTGYRGFAHAYCNRAAGARKANARRRARREGMRLMLTECVLGVQVSTDRRHTAIAAAGQVDGDLVFVGLARYLDGVDTAVTAVVDLTAARTVLAVVIDPHSPAATLIRPLTLAGVTVTEMSTSDVVVAHGQFLDVLNAGRLRRDDSPELTAAVRYAAQRPLGGASTWDRRGAVDTSPLDAATFAVWGVLSRPVPFFAVGWR